MAINTNIEQKYDTKVTATSTSTSLNLDLNQPYFSDITADYYGPNDQRRPIKDLLSLKALETAVNNTPNEKKGMKGRCVLKGFYKDGIKGIHNYKGSPFLVYDIDIKNTEAKKENVHLLNKAENSRVFKELQKISVLCWHSHSGFGMAGILYVPQLEPLLFKDTKLHENIGKAITDGIGSRLGIEFDKAQSRYRQNRFLAYQDVKRELNLTPHKFTYDIKIRPAVTHNGNPIYKKSYDHAGGSGGTIREQFNRNTDIHTALLDNGFTQLGNTNRYKHHSTTSASSGFTSKNRYINFSGSFSEKTSFTAFDLYGFVSFNGSFGDFYKDLKTKGYKDEPIKPVAFKMATKVLKTPTADRKHQIYLACEPLQRATVYQKLNFLKNNCKNENERTLFNDYLKLKDLRITYDKSIKIKKYVSEALFEVLDFSDKNKLTLLTAETGTGKTTAFINDYLKLRPNTRVLILAPLTGIVEQADKKYKDLICLTGKSKQNDHDKAWLNQMVMATYEQGTKHLKAGNNFDLIVIDEVHNLITANSYKEATICELTALLSNQKVIGLTGSPSPLFKQIGYKFLQVKKTVQNKTHLTTRYDNRDGLKIALQHLRNVTGKCIIRINSKNVADELKKELIRLKKYKKNEVLILSAESYIKNGADFQYLTKKEKFKDNVKLVITTSLIDEGLSIYQNDFTDVVYIDTNYNPLPESIKQFFARFRNKDDNRKNYLYLKEKEDQKEKNINAVYSYQNKIKELQEQGKDDFNKDSINNSHLFFENGAINRYRVAFDVSTLFFNCLNIFEFANFLELNYNLKLNEDKEYKKASVTIQHLKNNTKMTKKEIGKSWLNSKDETTTAVYYLTKNKAVKECLNFINAPASNEIYNLVETNLKTFERLFLKEKELKELRFLEINDVLVNKDTMLPTDIREVNRLIMLQRNIDLLEYGTSKTDIKNANKIKSFIKEVSTYTFFDTNLLFKLWKKQRSQSMKFTSFNLLDLVLYYHKYIFDSNSKNYRKLQKA